MTYTVFARKYRPQTFEEVVGQEAVVTTLKNALLQGRVAHAYLFAGPRGVGKTSIARILAKCLNCQKGPTGSPCNECDSCRCISEGRDHMDVIEIDGASNRGIDEIRNLRKNVGICPSSSPYKIYIIDEVHMLTREAFNALLKTLEEPPSHVKFFFATTAPHKLPETILSRCQRFDLKNISLEDIVNRLKQLAKKEKIEVEEEALRAIARYAKGGLRDSQSLLDQLWVFSEGKITVADVQGLLGAVPEEKVAALVERLIQKDAPGAVKIVHETLKEGKDWDAFIEQILWYLRDLLVVSTCGYNSELLENPWREAQFLKAQSQALSRETLMAMIYMLTEVKRRARDDFQQRVFLEMAVIKLAMMDFHPLSEILARLEELEKKLSSRGVVPAHTLNCESVKDTGDSPQEEALIEKEIQASPPKSIEEAWTQLLEKLHRERQSTWSYLKEGRLREDGEGELTLEFPKDRPFPKKYLETNAQERTMLEEYLTGILGRRPRLKFALYERAVIAGGEATKDTLKKEEKGKSLAEKAMEIFEGQVQKKGGLP
ncbi:MAG TPA: DNA polymerase III subunit gamma/tau [Candidatus Hypogeohydataceae bacterium YC41]